jgi:hypothetical protein
MKNLIALLMNAKKKMEKMLDDFNSALPTMKALGLSVTDLDLKIGWLPSVAATLRGSFRDMDAKKIQHLREGSANNKVLLTILRALETAANVRNLVRSIAVEGVEVYVRLGLNFAVDVKFISQTTIAASTEKASAVAS